jgi:hypothetical protein
MYQVAEINVYMGRIGAEYQANSKQTVVEQAKPE